MQTSSTSRASRRPAWLLIGLASLGALAWAAARSTLPLTTASARFSPGERGLNDLEVRAPYGSTVITFDVVPSLAQAGSSAGPFRVGGWGVSRPIGLFEEHQESSNDYPASGGVEVVPLETPVQLTNSLNRAATAALPEDRSLLARCGVYLLVTRQPVAPQRLEEQVSRWTAAAPTPAAP